MANSALFQLPATGSAGLLRSRLERILALACPRGSDKPPGHHCSEALRVPYENIVSNNEPNSQQSIAEETHNHSSKCTYTDSHTPSDPNTQSRHTAHSVRQSRHRQNPSSSLPRGRCSSLSSSTTGASRRRSRPAASTAPAGTAGCCSRCWIPSGPGTAAAGCTGRWGRSGRRWCG